MIETDDYIVCQNPRRMFWQKKRMEWLVVGYYDDDSEQPAAHAAAERRARHVAERGLPVRTLTHKRNVFDDSYNEDE
jgi:hypothetical protein